MHVAVGCLVMESNLFPFLFPLLEPNLAKHYVNVDKTLLYIHFLYMK